MFFVLRLPSLQSTWLLQRSVAVCRPSSCFCVTLPSTPRPFCVAAPQETAFFNSAAFYSSTSIASSISTWCSLTFSATFNLLPCVDDFQYPCFSSSVQLLASRHCSPHTSRPAVGTTLSVLLIVSCCWLCSSRLYVHLSEILVDLLLVVVQVLRLCAPFRQSGGASLVDFFSPLALLAVVLSVFSVFWGRLLQALLCGSLLLRSRHLSPPTPLLSIAPLRDHWSAVSVRDPQHHTTMSSDVCEVWLHSVWSGRCVAAAVRRWSPTPLCDTVDCVHSLSESFHRGLHATAWSFGSSNTAGWSSILVSVSVV